MSAEVIAQAKAGKVELVLTPKRVVPDSWYPPLRGAKVLCLASGGGQQAPVLAAAGADVTVLDASEAQLAQDRAVAEREGLSLQTVKGDMADLSAFEDGRFDLIFHPISNCFVPNVRPVWAEAHRVLKPQGVLLAGFVNPVLYLFDFEKLERGEMKVEFKQPYSDLESAPEGMRQRLLERLDPLEFGHSLEDQIGGQLEAGFVLTGFFEDKGSEPIVDEHLPVFIATRALAQPQR